MNPVNFRFDDSTFLYEPYPIGLARNVLHEDVFRELVEAWPPTELFEFKKILGNKYSLSEVNNPRQYHQFVRSRLPWQRFHAYIKGRDFLHKIIAMLYARHIDLGLAGNYLVCERPPLGALDKLKVFLKTRKLSARFEFSMLPAAGGYIKPHTDSPKKIITLVIAVMRPGEWDSGIGGGTEILRPCDITRNYNFMNRQFEFDEMQTVKTFPFEPNQAVIFIKTFNSWHAVHPIRGEGSEIMRKTVTINIETK